MNCLVEMMHLAHKQVLKIAVSGADAEHLGLFDHAQKSYWLALQAQLPQRGI